MHQTMTLYLKRKNINKYFERLSEILLNNSSPPISILIVGGAAMALKYNRKRMTVDIDICIKEQTKLYNSV